MYSIKKLKLIVLYKFDTSSSPATKGVLNTQSSLPSVKKWFRNEILPTTMETYPMHYRRFMLFFYDFRVGWSPLCFPSQVQFCLFLGPHLWLPLHRRVGMEQPGKEPRGPPCLSWCQVRATGDMVSSELWVCRLFQLIISFLS